jgi:hypothetical protein
MNYLPTAARVTIPEKQTDLLTGKTVQGEVTLPPRGVLALAREAKA